MSQIFPRPDACSHEVAHWVRGFSPFMNIPICVTFGPTDAAAGAGNCGPLLQPCNFAGGGGVTILRDDFAEHIRAQVGAWPSTFANK